MTWRGKDWNVGYLHIDFVFGGALGISLASIFFTISTTSTSCFQLFIMILDRAHAQYTLLFSCIRPNQHRLREIISWFGRFLACGMFSFLVL